MSTLSAKPNKFHVGLLASKGHTRHENNPVKQARLKLAERNKINPIETKVTQKQIEESKTFKEPSDLCERMKDISDRLAKLAEPDTTDKFIRNTEHRGYIMSYPEVLPVYTASKISSASNMPEPCRESDGWLSKDYPQFPSEKLIGEKPFGLDFENCPAETKPDRLTDGIRNAQTIQSPYLNAQADSRLTEDPEGTLDELALHLLKRFPAATGEHNEEIADLRKHEVTYSSNSKPTEPTGPTSGARNKNLSAETNNKPNRDLSSVVMKAASTLESVNRRRIHLENNLEAIGRTQFGQSVFEILQYLGENSCSLEKARIQARIIDAIASTAPKKMDPSSRRGQTGLSVPPGTTHLKRTKPGANRQRLASPSPVRLSSTHSVTDFLGSDFEWVMDHPRTRSTSPTWHQAPWRMNRTRAKRPGYPRIVNDPVPARRATLRLSDQKDSGLMVLKGPTVRPNTRLIKPMTHTDRVPKTVRFHEQQTPQFSNRRTQSDIPECNRNRRTNALHSKMGIIPLGRAQYSAQTLSMESVNSDQRQEWDLRDQKSRDTQDVGVDFPSSDSVPIPTLESTPKPQHSSSSTDSGSSRPLYQPSEWNEKQADKDVDSSRAAALRALIEAAVSDHMGTSSVPVSPVYQGERLPTPQTSPEMTERSPMKTFHTPIHSPDRFSPVRMDAAVGFPSNTSPGYSNLNRQTDAGTCYELEGYSDHEIKTPMSSPTGRFSVVHTPCSPRSIRMSPTRLAVVACTQTSPAHQLPTENKKDKYNSTSTPADPDRWSKTDSHIPSEMEFSLTAPNTFSDGVWLIDRSEGEAPCPVAQEAYERISANMDFGLQSPDSHLSANSTSDAFTWNGDTPRQERRLSDGEHAQCKTFTFRPGPMKNPLLEIMALQESKRFHMANLTNRERTQVKQIASDLRKAQSDASKLDWLMSLSGVGTRVQSRKASHPKDSNSTPSFEHITQTHDMKGTNARELNETKLAVQSDESETSAVSLSPGEQLPHGRESQRTGNPHETPGSPKQSPSDTLDMVQAVDSDAETLNDPVYEEDYVTDSTA